MIRALLRRSLVTGLAGAATSTAALTVVAKLEGRGAVQPLNATSHWLHGDRAARQRQADLARTGVGLGTHVAATIFWASLFETWMLDRPARDASEVAARAAVVAGLAAVVDYTVTPRRFTPGWELVLSKRSMALVYAAMAVGFAASSR
ncbi:hypothetical protein RHAL1_01891 [Beijerinckiaceae bacterium RH AL1]|nr:hypothetical protein RHCH11_RHCH11_01853 [Beijerinckiaceae bacterium RH CH11]VVB45747.1 hypothetical protein RHAL8_01849 [Beijerinckiaceae bacterium RH AL8]VVC54982.1 hypothetical protein RHAL1_01891 [Beijerinckiaceae bacterium RH AL1]